MSSNLGDMVFRYACSVKKVGGSDQQSCKHAVRWFVEVRSSFDQHSIASNKGMRLTLQYS